MNTKLITASLIASFAFIGAAQASPNSEPDNTPFQGVYAQNDSGASRAQVLAEHRPERPKHRRSKREQRRLQPMRGRMERLRHADQPRADERGDRDAPLEAAGDPDRCGDHG